MLGITSKKLKIGELPDDHALALSFITDAQQVRKFLVSNLPTRNLHILSISADRVRYHPGASCIVLYKIVLIDDKDNQTETSMYVKALNKVKFDEAVEHSKTMAYQPAKISDRVLINSEHQSLFYEFPNDAVLTNLNLLENVKNFDHILKENNLNFKWNGNECQVDRFRYKPENRFVGVIRSPKGADLFIRFETPLSVQRMSERIEKIKGLVALSDSVSLALPKFCDVKTGLIGVEQLAGEKLSEILRTNNSKAGLTAGVKALARLHERSIEAIPEFNVNSKITGLVRFLAKLERRYPAIADHAGAVASWISWESENLPESSQCLIHGDYHPGQILIDDSKTFIVDCDRLSMGPADVDLGNQAAQLWFLNRRGRIKDGEQFEKLALEIYLSETNSQLNVFALQYWRVIGLVELAAKQFRRLKPCWPDMISVIMAEARETIEKPIII